MAESEAGDQWVDVLGNGGILKKILVEGNGPLPEKGQEAKVHYVGTLASNGDKFDSSRDRDDYFKFTLGAGRVIKGWDEGVATMKIGERCILRCRHDYAYGEAGSPPKIPGGATLDFDVELFRNWADVDGVEGVTCSTLASEPEHYKTIRDEAHVTFNFAICDDAGSAKGETKSSSLEINDEGSYSEWPQWFHKCLCTMKNKQGKVFEITNTKDNEIPKSWGVSDGEFCFRVDVQDLSNMEESFERSTDENIEAASKRKDKGNAFFKAGKFEHAVKQYKKGCDDLEYEIERKKNPESLKEAFSDKMHDLYVSLYANMSMAYLKQKKYNEGIESATKVIQYDPKHLKALCRRAQCFAQSNRLSEAEKDCEAVLAEDSNNSTAKQVLKYAKGKVAAEKRKMRKMATRMFKSKKKKVADQDEAGESKEEEVVAKDEEPKKAVEVENMDAAENAI